MTTQDKELTGRQYTETVSLGPLPHRPPCIALGWRWSGPRTQASPSGARLDLEQQDDDQDDHDQSEYAATYGHISLLLVRITLLGDHLITVKAVRGAHRRISRAAARPTSSPEK